MLAPFQHVLAALLLLSPFVLATPAANPSSIIQAAHLNPRAKLIIDATSNETSVYICQHFDWAPPCLYLPLGSGLNGQMDFWMAPEPGGPGPFGNGNYSVGSWGPSPRVTTVWEDHFAQFSDPLAYPGTGRVDAYWQGNIWTWYPTWQD